jgi:hypothetical protein
VQCVHQLAIFWGSVILLHLADPHHLYRTAFAVLRATKKRLAFVAAN